LKWLLLLALSLLLTTVHGQDASGSGEAAAGSGSDAGSGSAAAGSGSGSKKPIPAETVSPENDNTFAALAVGNTPLDRHIAKAESLLDRMTWQVNHETVWARNVHEVIGNYQYKYGRVLEDIKARSKKVDQLRVVLQELKAAKLHQTLQKNFNKAGAELGQLSTTGSGSKYKELADKITAMKGDIAAAGDASVAKTLATVEQQLADVSKEDLPPPSFDALATVGGGSGSGSE